MLQAGRWKECQQKLPAMQLACLLAPASARLITPMKLDSAYLLHDAVSCQSLLITSDFLMQWWSRCWLGARSLTCARMCLWMASGEPTGDVKTPLLQLLMLRLLQWDPVICPSWMQCCCLLLYNWHPRQQKDIIHNCLRSMCPLGISTV